MLGDMVAVCTSQARHAIISGGRKLVDHVPLFASGHLTRLESREMKQEARKQKT